MLSGETAAGKYPVETLKTMVKIAETTEEAINYYDFMQYKLGLGIAGTLDMQELTTKAGVFFGNHKLNGTAQISYGPTIEQKIKPGIKLINHLCYYVKYYFEYDFLIGPFIEYKTDSLFKMNLSFFYMQKSSYIQNLPNKNRLVYSSCPAFFFDFYF